MRLGARVLVGMIGLTMAPMVKTAGFELGEQGTRPLGTALAGIGTGTEAMSAAFWNPAGMAADPDPGIGAGAALISPSVRFSGADPDGGEAGRDGLPPRLFARDRMGKGLVLGFGLTVPFGLRTEYDPGWAGRYHALESELDVRQGTLSVAKSVGGGVSLAGGLVVQRLDVELTNAIKTPTGVDDGHSRITGDSHSYGWLAGVLWETGDTRVGLAYHSSVVHDIGGTQVADLAAALGGYQRFPVTARLELPGRAVLGVRRALSERLRAMASLQWSQWRTYDELFVDGPGGNDTSREKDWDNVWSLGIGMAYDLTGRWTLRGGYRFEQTPVPDKEHRDPRLPDADRQRLAVGGSLAWGSGWSADVAYNYIDFGDADIANSDSAAVGANPETLVGSFDSSAHVLDFQVTRRF